MEKIRINLINPKHLNTVVSLLSRLHAHSLESYTHSLDVADKAVTIGIDLGLSQHDLSTLYTASLLHDIGKLTIDRDLLHKPNATEFEKNLIREQHIQGTIDILGRYFENEIVSLAGHHHERLNCSGYPENLNGRKLGLLDRILQVSDVASALLMNRSYQNAFKPEQVVEILNNLVRRGELDKLCVQELEKLYLLPQEDTKGLSS